MTLEVLEPGSIYHIYNHAVGKENLFLSADNYTYFLKRYQFFINPVADTYVYCLMPNHLHFLIEVRQDIILPSGNKSEVPQYISKQFSNLFSSYAQAFNKHQNRRGNLFMSQFRRQRIDSDDYLTTVIPYIHLNPFHHGFVEDFSKWKYSSYNLFFLPAETFLSRDKVIKWFGNLSEFEKAHRNFKTEFPPGSFDKALG